MVYLGNFGPEISETLLAKHFDGPSMFIAAAEETGNNLVQGRGDAYCGMLNASYNLKLRNIKAYIPEYPVGTAEECADMIAEFVPIARAVIGLSSLKIISFGPRPLNFLACNAPIKQLYNLGVEIEENSELDLFEAFNRHAGDPRIPDVVKDMEAELGTGNKKPEILEKLAQYELTLLDWIDGAQGIPQVCCHCRKVLACIPDAVRLRSLLRKQPSYGKRNPGFLRGGYLRRLKRVHRCMRKPGCSYPVGYQQHGSQGSV